MKLRTIEITASRTLQIVQYEPLTLTTKETYEVPASFNKLSRKEQLAEKRRLTRQAGRLLEAAVHDAAERYRD